MRTPAMGNRLPDGRTWAADTGCFAKPEAFTMEGYLRWLGRWAHAADRCLFATAPDRFGDGEATMRVALPALPLIRAAGYRAALVAQPGIERLGVPWDAIDALFVGGPNAWRQRDAVLALVREANDRGKHTHLGRVNSYAALRNAYRDGYKSADGTFVAFGGDANVARLRAWLGRLEGQAVLPGWK